MRDGVAGDGDGPAGARAPPTSSSCPARATAIPRATCAAPRPRATGRCPASRTGWPWSPPARRRRRARSTARAAGTTRGGHALMRGAGGTVVDEHGREVAYRADGDSRARNAYGGSPAVARGAGAAAVERDRRGRGSGPRPASPGARARHRGSRAAVARAGMPAWGRRRGTASARWSSSSSARDIAAARATVRALLRGRRPLEPARRPADRRHRDGAGPGALDRGRRAATIREAALRGLSGVGRVGPVRHGTDHRGRPRAGAAGRGQPGQRIAHAREPAGHLCPRPRAGRGGRPRARADSARDPSASRVRRTRWRRTFSPWPTRSAPARARTTRTRRALSWARAEADPAVADALVAGGDAPPRSATASTWAGCSSPCRTPSTSCCTRRRSRRASCATVRRGGDTDTNAAIAGALLGAVHGRDAVPLQWRQMVLSCRPVGVAGGRARGRCRTGPWTSTSWRSGCSSPAVRRPRPAYQRGGRAKPSPRSRSRRRSRPHHGRGRMPSARSAGAYS